MSSRRLSIVTGLLVLMIVIRCQPGVMAAEEGSLKGLSGFMVIPMGSACLWKALNLEYFQGETHLRFKAAEIREKADGRGRSSSRQEVFLTHEDLKVTGDQFCFDTAEESGTFSGHVVLEREESRDEQGEVVKEGIRLVCGNLYLQTKEKAFIATEAPRDRTRGL